jgi:hypothetical protein
MAGIPPDDADLGQDEVDYITPEHDLDESHQMQEADEINHDAYNKYISARVCLPNPHGILKNTTVKKRKRDENFDLVGHFNQNPILDTSLYEVEFDDGVVGTYAANVIAENI